MNIALFFGSFNPIHTGHLIIAQSICNLGSFQEVWLVITPQNPNKTKASLIAHTKRYILADIATDKHPQIRPSNIEFNLPQPSYTIDTLAYLQSIYPNRKFTIVMGWDNFKTIEKWKNYEKIIAHFSIIVYKRGTDKIEIDSEKFPKVTLMDAPLLDISATMIRENFSKGIDNKYLLPDEVIEEIQKGGYYPLA
ncbi:MAG: nicotinate (nicotinamide) nucleotide adenylyltransferase [Chitinophagales bacterium]|jgi:nicotinate-nucleotide adenylyltransferase|nr:nicotinate (nicotinamide) nucleotide adenylyltransferase [Chitinophagales bacterium]